MILKRLGFLKRDCIIINDMQKAKNISIKYTNDYVEAMYAERLDWHNEFIMEDLAKSILELGKKLYEINKEQLTKIKSRYYGTEVFKYDYFMFDRKNKITSETAKIIEEWSKNNITFFYKPFTNHNQAYIDSIDMHSLIDISIFMYLVISAINNNLIDKEPDYAKKKKLKVNSNKISFIDIMEDYTDKDYSDFYARIISYLNFYEDSYIDKTRPIIKETTKLILKETKDKDGKKIYKPTIYKCFENTYSFYIFVIKMAMYAFGNDFKIINMCGCGIIIDGKSELCKDCNKMYDALRKSEEKGKNIS